MEGAEDCIVAVCAGVVVRVGVSVYGAGVLRLGRRLIVAAISTRTSPNPPISQMEYRGVAEGFGSFRVEIAASDSRSAVVVVTGGGGGEGVSGMCDSNPAREFAKSSMEEYRSSAFFASALNSTFSTPSGKPSTNFLGMGSGSFDCLRNNAAGVSAM